ncbi:Deoxyadenosine kinase / Deoxyguanosine kinase [Fulvivirga imtechensis AK7]|uniref:Deoxyadenosine kinase / Deoxyguanosine kinase n=1 Tax=Fulvivirga imtechensis AK7 TaxID=1237149 RepID=L8JXM4_9BACT|nr:deoxynucleoside kinase [Fulvivirga imtechensis]ELR71977.1 Deoxyadenosine kinase / Deoxyguanosine kinase [Fulvivirga imtechensis AK7]
MHIAICGNIGSGKTTLAKMLSRHYGWHAELESVEDNPYLADFYEDMERWSFHLQVFFLNSRFTQVKKIRESWQSTVQDRTIYEDAYIFASNLYKSGFINDRDYGSYLTLFESMMQHVEPPDLLIYLKADIPKLVSQIEKRGRDYENAIRLDYLKNLNEHYKNWIQGYDLGKLLVIDVNNLDFVARREDFAHIVSKIDVELHGLFSTK